VRYALRKVLALEAAATESLDIFLKI